MTADRLLDIQRLDVESDRLNYRRLNLTQRQELAVLQADQARQQADIDLVAAARVEVATRQRRCEAEAQIAFDRAATDESRLYGGEVQGVKNLQALQHEIVGLRDRQRRYEDQALEAMEEAELFAAQGAALEYARADVDQRVAKLEDAIAAIDAEINDAMERITAERSDAVSHLEGARLAEYEGLRPRFGAATVVRFDGSKCVGCPLAMPAMEIDRIKHLGEHDPTNCEECGRIVVR